MNLLQAETNADMEVITPVSSTLNVVIEPVIIYPRTVMSGTDSANTTVPDTAGTAAGLHSTTDGLIVTADTAVDAIQTDLDNATDGLGALKGLIDALNDATQGLTMAQFLASKLIFK